jgi:TET-Associated Glycosyltransferase
VNRRTEAKLVLFVPTKGRIDSQHTLTALPRVWHPRIYIVCPKEEIKAHKKRWPRCNVIKQGNNVRGIADARAWIFKHASLRGFEKIAMLDDDIRFAARVKTLKYLRGIGETVREWDIIKDAEPELGKLVNLGPGDKRIGSMLFGLEKMLDTYAHAGMHGRLMSNNHAYEWRENTRIQQIYAYHVPTVMKHCVVGRKIMRDDFDYELQLLTKGFSCVVYCWVVGEQARGFHGKGGQDSSRTLKINNADAYKLAKLFPGLVTVVDRDYNKMPRKEVIVHWRKAAALGQAREFI